MFEVGDWVKVIPSTYVNLAKRFLNYPNSWRDSDPENDSDVALGGIYKINSVAVDRNNKWYCLLKSDLNNMGKMLHDDLRCVSSVSKCPFNVGDNVRFKPSCSTLDEEYLIKAFEKSYNFSDKNKIYTITFVLNEYYIFLNYPRGHELATPFRWEDFELSEE